MHETPNHLKKTMAPPGEQIHQHHQELKNHHQKVFKALNLKNAKDMQIDLVTTTNSPSLELTLIPSPRFEPSSDLTSL